MQAEFGARARIDGAGRRRRPGRVSALAGVALLAAALTGCGLTIPADPDGSLERARGGELRIGIAAEPGMSTDAHPPEGPLPELGADFAESIDAAPVWELGGEETLVGMLESGDIDLALGHFTPETPWTERAAISRPFAGSAGGVDGADAELVALMPLGENALLSAFEGYIDGRGLAR
ncbi:hypothetical protein MUN78_00365 [Leucobacter allii]|uniref:ABC transporter substrate-binding protein n=1 Tax=Leucobacter allii TaxID=2932247 RepID=A0ABY4FM29_9MICO|nr:hypothetical protein [Leucobacter allii]UOQ57333.1 hypothetical protein MUN78_00365 [Leucobacter allii]